MTTQLETRVFHSFDDASSDLKAVFSSDRSENPFLNWDWMQAYWGSTARRGESLLLVGVYRGGAAIGGAAFRVGGRLVFRTARLLTEGRADRQDFAGEQSPQAARAILAALREQGILAVRCTDVDGTSILARVLRGANALESHQYPCPFRDLSANAPVDVKSNRTFQKRVPNYGKRLAAFGEVSFQVMDFDRDRAASLALLPQLFALHDLRHAGRRNSWKSNQNREFLAKYLRTAERTNFLAFVTFLDGAPVAFDLGFRAGSRFVLYIPAFHPAFERFRLGHINRHFSFQYCKDAGITTYDFSRGDSFAKRVWAHGATESFAFTAQLKPGLASNAAAFLLDLPVRAKSWARDNGIPAKVASWSQWFRRPAEIGATQVPVVSFEMPESLRYSSLAKLPLPSLTNLVEVVFLTQTDQKDVKA